MKPHEIRTGKLYTDGQGRFRQIIEFYDDDRGKRMVKYSKGFIYKGKWKEIGVKVCSKQKFAEWAETGFVFVEGKAS